MDREIWRGKDVGYIVKKKMNRSCRKNGMVSVNRWGFGSVNRAVKKGEEKEMDQEIKQRIETLKKEKDAVILAHYYVDGEVQEIADYVGDSYYLAELATTVPQKTIIFCGVSFMGESAKILSPEKTVIMADRSADCPMAHMVEVEKIREVRKEYPDVAVVCYVNSMAEIKAESDVCVTSSNALKIVKKLPNKDIFTFHEAFPYFARAYGLNVVGVVNREPGDALSPAQLAQLVRQVKELGNPPLFVEPQYDDMAAQTLASETGAKVYALDPVVTGPADPAEALTYYESVMRQNMQTLQEALKE